MQRGVVLPGCLGFRVAGFGGCRGRCDAARRRVAWPVGVKSVWCKVQDCGVQRWTRYVCVLVRTWTGTRAPKMKHSEMNPIIMSIEGKEVRSKRKGEKGWGEARRE
jgi:hypothetical protein